MEHLVDTIIELQSKANKQIDVYGQMTMDMAEELERLYSMLTPEQESELINRMDEIEC